MPLRKKEKSTPYEKGDLKEKKEKEEKEEEEEEEEEEGNTSTQNNRKHSQRRRSISVDEIRVRCLPDTAETACKGINEN
jgi:hypothetical protein